MLSGEGPDFINNWPFSDVTTTLENTAIVSERPELFFEINESWYYMLNLPALHWGKKNRRVKIKGRETALTY